MRDSYQLVGHYVTEGVWWGVEGKMELKDRFCNGGFDYYLRQSPDLPYTPVGCSGFTL